MLFRFGKILALALCVVSGAARGDPSVVDAYRAVQAAGIAPDLTYELRRDAKGWGTLSPDWGTSMPVLVDGANGYILIADEGTGGGSFETEVVLWRQADGTPLLGIGETAYNPPWPMTTRVRFFGFDTKEWGDWTDYVWPDVGFADFMADDMTLADLRALAAIGSSVHVTLPRQGKNPVARLVTRTEEIDAVCSGDDWFVPADRAPYITYCVDMEGHIARRLELIWDPVQVQFSKSVPSK